MELVKQIVKVGNSAGVILPREWLNGTARVELISKPLNIKKELFEILEDYLEDIIGLYIVGSYARGDENKKSDVDILAVTNNTNKKITHGKYEIVLISEKQLEDTLKKNILPLLPMIKESKSVMNEKLLEKYKNFKIQSKNLGFYFDSVSSAVKVCEASINNRKNSEIVSDGIAYSLVLNLRSCYIVDLLIRKRKWLNKKLLDLIKKMAGSLEAYEGYIRVKSNLKEENKLKKNEALKIVKYIHEKLDEHKKWARRR